MNISQRFGVDSITIVPVPAQCDPWASAPNCILSVYVHIRGPGIVHASELPYDRRPSEGFPPLLHWNVARLVAVVPGQCLASLVGELPSRLALTVDVRDLLVDYPLEVCIILIYSMKQYHLSLGSIRTSTPLSLTDRVLLRSMALGTDLGKASQRTIYMLIVPVVGTGVLCKPLAPI